MDKEEVLIAANKVNGYLVFAKETKSEPFNEGFLEGAKYANSNWIRVSDNLHEPMVDVSIYESNKFGCHKFKTGFYDGLNRIWNVYYDDDETLGYYHSEYITHWKHLPDVPR